MKKVFLLLAVPAIICAGTTLILYTLSAERKAAATHVITSTVTPARKPDVGKKKDAGPVAPDALSKIYSDIEQREYAASYDALFKAWQSPNRAHNMRAYYSPGQWKLQNRVDSAGHNWKLTINTLGIYADGHCLAKAEPGTQAGAAADQVLFDYPTFSEQYFNSKAGVRQNFIIRQAPAGTKQIAVKLQVSGMDVQQQNEAVLLTRKGQQLSYNGLKAWDANGKALEARMVVAHQQISLVATAEGATYPITIDPIIANGNPANANAIVESNQVNSGFGASVSGAGDVNGDGYSDVIIGANFFDNGQTDEGAAFVYHGSASGINTTIATMIESNKAGAYFGESVSGAGDVNGDGYSDIIVGAGNYNNGPAGFGAAFIYHGSATGISTTATTIIESNRSGSHFGESVSGAGDVNGDGYSDIILGASYYSNGQNNEGAVFIYYGSAGGINATVATTIESNQAGANLGWSVSGAGDVNGDGYSDVIVGAPYYNNGQAAEGAAFVYRGSASGISTTAATMVESNQTGAWLGSSVSGAGDVNGDGYSDVVVGAERYDNGQTDEGAAFVYHGSASGISTAVAATTEGNQAGAYFGESVSGAGDVNGDGYSDVIVGAYRYDNGQTDEGGAFIYHGSANGIITTAAAILESNQANAYIGVSVSGAGDVNGDGYSDVSAGANGYDNGQIDEGAAFVYHGSASSISTAASARVESNRANAFFGQHVSKAGDVNGDGYSDIVVGAPYYDNGQFQEGAAFVYHGSANGISTTAAAILEADQAGAYFGYSISGAGDVNGDGYSDIIVGAYAYDNGQSNEGAAFVYHGSATGINTIAAAIVESNQANAFHATSVSGAGDVNGDGYSDIIVGTPNYDNGQSNEGAFFVYHGSASGISTAAAAIVESNQASAAFGISVSGAGDVNGDGYSDIIIGSFAYGNGQANEGAAFVYHGSAGGINTMAATMLESNQSESYLGISVSGAGDVNGDGYSDIIVGANYYDNGQANEGAAFVYHGSPAGISTTASAVLECDQAGAVFGASVSEAGDVNGDGYSDVVVGATGYDNGQTDEGAAFIYHGSANGISTTAAAVAESNQVNAQFGVSVSGAGDVNGDGYSDVIAGAPHYANGQPDEGAYFVYQGNAGGGRRRNLQLYTPAPGSSQPRNIFERSNIFASYFKIALYSKNPDGRSKGKLVWETRSQGQPFSTSPLTNSTQFTGQQNTYTNLGTTGLLLANTVVKPGFATYIRARIKYNPATSLNGEVYSPWVYVPTSFRPLKAPTLMYVDSSIAASGNGTSWATAFKELREALPLGAGNHFFIDSNGYDQSTIDTILVAKGTYKPDAGSNRDTSFALLWGGVKLYGGYPSGGGTKDITANPTVLSGDIGTLNDSTDNSYHVVVIAAIVASGGSPVLDGFTITKGNANGNGSKIYRVQVVDQNSGGGGVACNYTDVNIVNCTFKANTASKSGGGLFSNNTSAVFTNCYFAENKCLDGGGMFNTGFSNTKLISCVFTGNTASNNGGGINNSNKGSFAYPTLTGCTFAGNAAANNGGGSYNDSSSITLNQCIFSSNTAGNMGGGMMKYRQGAATATNCLFVTNSAANFGGGIENLNGGSVVATNSTLAANSSARGGGMDNQNAGTVLTNCIIWSNTAANTPGIYNDRNAYISVGYSNVQAFITGTGNLVTDPLFVNAADPDGADNLFGTADDGLQLQPCSPAINTGSNAAIPAGMTTDITGRPRTYNNMLVDRGAYEYQGTASDVFNLAINDDAATLAVSSGSDTAFTTSCRTIARLRSVGTSPVSGSTTAKVWVDVTQQFYNGHTYVKRHYEITPATNTSTATGRITIYAFQQEFNDFNNTGTNTNMPSGPTDVANIARLRVFKFSSNGTGLPGSYLMEIDPPDNNIIWNNTLQRWEITFDVTGFGAFFIANADFTILPLNLLSFSGKAITQNSAMLSWHTSNEINTSYFELQRSSDSRSFTAIATLQARGTPQSQADYSYEDKGLQPGLYYYRLRTVDKDGKENYSAVVTIRLKGINAITVYPVPAKDVVWVNSTSTSLMGKSLQLMDMEGRGLQTIRITTLPQPVNISMLAAGTYLLKLPDETTVKLVKQ